MYVDASIVFYVHRNLFDSVDASWLIFHLMFFFYCYGHHRDLHSFPTRRSSDLSPTAPIRCRDGIVSPMSVLRITCSLGDRKSTRLNSSHQIISYAVFCLKKKKKKESIRVHH